MDQQLEMYVFCVASCQYCHNVSIRFIAIPMIGCTQVLLLWRRALSDRLDRVFCLVRADLLDYDVSVKAEQQLHSLMQGKGGTVP